MTDAQTSVEVIASKLTDAQRDIMLGHIVDIPPEEGDDLETMGLKGEAYWHENGDGRRLIWPITPLGLAVRAHLSNQGVK